MDKFQLFDDKLSQIYPAEHQQILAALQAPALQTFRINTLSAGPKSILSELTQAGFDVRESEVPGGYINYSATSLSTTPQFAKGEIYIQELASMLPALALDPRPGERILDMCAAPGSKTTQLAALADNQAEIWAVEKSRSRYFKLQEVLKLYRARAETVCADARALIYSRPEWAGSFDKILLDAPCSNEGHLNLGDLSALDHWKLGMSKQLSQGQKGLIMTASKLLKPGGTLLYSTCTFSVEENEEVVDWVLRKSPNLEMAGIALPHISSAQTGRTYWRKKAFNSALAQSLRILPDEVYTGFFLAKLTKRN